MIMMVLLLVHILVFTVFYRTSVFESRDDNITYGSIFAGIYSERDGDGRQNLGMGTKMMMIFYD